MFCGSLGYGAVSATDDLVRRADVVLAIGCRFSEFTTKRWTLVPSDADLIHVDIDPGVLGRYYVPAVGICADAALTTAALLAAAEARTPPPGERLERAAAARAAYLEQTRLPPPGGPGPVSSAAIVAALRTMLGGGREPAPRGRSWSRMRPA